MKFYRFLLICCLGLTSTLYAAERVLRVAVSAYEPPFVMQGANSKFFGYDISLMEKVCATIHFRCQFIPLPFKQLIPAVASNQVDMAVGSIFITPERARQVLFSTPYFPSRLRFLVRATTNVDNLNAKILTGKRIGLTELSFVGALKPWRIRASQIVSYVQEDALVKALNNGSIQYALLDNSTAVYWHQNSSGNLRVVGRPIIYGFGLGIAISPENAALVNPVNAALLKYQNSAAFILNFNKYLATVYDF